ncbi:MAG TPA: chromate efflux transporter [Candidatus Sulfotelmatobacter sp.]|jgi:chromate transporter|nr:chromate efflux transporter [Candidatus Sulfotelmatobacter sp.]
MPSSRIRAAAEVLSVFTRLGLTSFGGPVAHLGYFRSELVERRRWLNENDFADMVALCQFMPGPTSSQVGLALGQHRAGLWGAVAAWVGFTLPSALALMTFAYGVGLLGDLTRQPWLHGLKLVAVAVVAQAVWGMARSLCPDRPRITMAAVATMLALFVPTSLGQVAAIVLGGTVGLAAYRSGDGSGRRPAAGNGNTSRRGKGLAVAALLAFTLLLTGLPSLAALTGSHDLALFSGFFRSGALVFGGGHVVLPLLQETVVPSGWVSNDAFLVGYGAAQAMPGPLFTFAAYLGVLDGGWRGGLMGLLAIYLPSFLLLAGLMPFWDDLRQRPPLQAALSGVNAAVVGLLLAALYHPVWTSAVAAPKDFSLTLAAFILLQIWKTPPWLVVLLGAACAQALARI